MGPLASEPASSAGGVKPCARCGLTLPLEHFHASSGSEDGRRAWCRHCSAGRPLPKRPEICVGEGLVLRCDPADYPALSGHSWRTMRVSGSPSPVTSVPSGDRYVPVTPLHVMKITGGSVTYANSDRLDVRRANLHISYAERSGPVLRCLLCGARGGPELFHRDSSRPSGRYPYCRACRSTRST